MYAVAVVVVSAGQGACSPPLTKVEFTSGPCTTVPSVPTIPDWVPVRVTVSVVALVVAVQVS